MSGRLAGKRVLITGTGGGQGAAAQELFAREGAVVVGCDISPGSAQQTAAEVSAEGHECRGHTVNLTDPDAAATWVHEAARDLGGIDVLYNNAAAFRFEPFGEMSLETWRYVLLAELDIVFHTTSAAWRHLSSSGAASIINVGSISALRGMSWAGQAAHAAAKGGIIALTKTLAAEGAEHDIRANVISPGVVMSPATDSRPQHRREKMISLQLIQRPGTGGDIAHLALYLASDESSWVTGQNVSIDGGWTAGYRGVV